MDIKLNNVIAIIQLMQEHLHWQEHTFYMDSLLRSVPNISVIHNDCACFRDTVFTQCNITGKVSKQCIYVYQLSQSTCHMMCHPTSTPNTLFLAWWLAKWSQEVFPKGSRWQPGSNSFPPLLTPVVLCTLFQQNCRNYAVLTCHPHWIWDVHSTICLLVLSELQSFCYTVSLIVLLPTYALLYSAHPLIADLASSSNKAFVHIW